MGVRVELNQIFRADIFPSWLGCVGRNHQSRSKKYHQISCGGKKAFNRKLKILYFYYWERKYERYSSLYDLFKSAYWS